MLGRMTSSINGGHRFHDFGEKKKMEKKGSAQSFAR